MLLLTAECYIISFMISSTSTLHSFVAAVLCVFITPAVVAKPLHVSTDMPFVASLVQDVIGEQDSVSSLMTGKESPHTFSLRPRDMQQLQTADLVVMVGEELSPNVSRTINDVALNVPTLAMLELPELQEHLYRASENTEAGSKPSKHVHDVDPHIWIDPIIVTTMAVAIGEQLAQLDAERADEFRQRANVVANKLQAFHDQQLARWSNQSIKNFVTVHENSRYFLQRYNLSSVGSLFEDDHSNPSVKHLKQLRESMRANNVECAITDSITNPRWVNTLVSGQSVDVVTVDILGTKDNDSNYLDVLNNMSDGLAACIGIL